jgi:hypothetical protein
MIARTLEEWRAPIRETLAKFEGMDPDDPPEGMGCEEWAAMLERFKASCRRMLDQYMDGPPSEQAQREGSEACAEFMAELDRLYPLPDHVLTKRGRQDA